MEIVGIEGVRNVAYVPGVEGDVDVGDIHNDGGKPICDRSAE